jgi:hypothetical protein
LSAKPMRGECVPSGDVGTVSGVVVIAETVSPF